MTSLRFVGELPLWIGLSISLVVCFLSWRYYSRESFELSRRMRWFLPLLRSLAFFLGIMMLTSPVLHHRKTVGELGKVQIYLDQSNSMTMRDTHLAVDRKLKIAENLGWFDPEGIQTSLPELAAQISGIQQDYTQRMNQLLVQFKSASDDDNSDKNLSTQFNTMLKEVVKQLEKISQQLPQQLSQQLKLKHLDKLETLQASKEVDEALVQQFVELIGGLDAVRGGILDEFEGDIVNRSGSGMHSPAAALTQFDEASRWHRVELALHESPEKVLQELQQFHDVEVFALNGENTVPVQFNNDSNVSEAVEIKAGSQKKQSNGPSEFHFSAITNLSSGVLLHQKASPISEETSGDSPAQKAVVLITDGNHNIGSSPLQMAKVLGQQNVQVFTVAIGAEKPAVDIAITGIEVPDTIFKKDSVRGTLILRDSLPVNRSFLAQIRLLDKVLWEEELRSLDGAAGTERRVGFQFSVEELFAEQKPLSASDVQELIKHLELTAAILPLSDEAETGNNIRDFHLGVMTENHRLLILDGRARWETRYLRNVFERDDKWDVNTIIAGPGTENLQLPRGDQSNQFPESRNELFEYDFIIFGELNPRLLEEYEQQWLKEFVEIRGGGLIFIDGQRQVLQQYLDSEFESLIPIEWLPTENQSIPTELVLTDQGASKANLKLANTDQENREFWKQLPVPHSIVAVAPLAGTEVLLEAVANDVKFPLMAWRRVGAGRVLYLASDESWRWRYKVADLWHQRIWNQLAKFVMPRSFSVSDEFLSLDTGAVNYQAGSSVEIRAQLKGVDGKPLSDATTEALIWKDGQIVSTVHLTAGIEMPGTYRGVTSALPSGDYEVSVRASGFSDSALQARSRFVVEENESDEMLRTSANYELLEQMAIDSGGEFLKEEEMNRLPELLSPLSRGQVIESETLLWQSYWWFAMMIGLLTLEWILRKRAGLL